MDIINIDITIRIVVITNHSLDSNFIISMFVVFDVNDQSGRGMKTVTLVDSHTNHLHVLQQLMGATQLTPILHKNMKSQPFRAYVNTQGLAQRLTFNYFAWNVLNKLGFTDASKGFNAYCGNVVLTNGKGLGLTVEEVQRVQFIVNVLSGDANPLNLPLLTSDWETYPKLKQSLLTA